jgi:ABC-2 type transport system permease protein
MRAYQAVFKLRLSLGLQYRAAALAGLATQFFWGLMSIMVYDAFYTHSSAVPDMSFQQVVTYIWLQQAFLTFVMLWFRDNELFNMITSGNIAYELCRPCGIYGFWYAKLVAQRLSAAFLRCLPILLVAYILPGRYRLSLPANPGAALSFVVTLLLGLLVLVAISMLIIPIPLMPAWVQQIAYALPFRLSADFPYRVYSGHIPLQEAVTGVGAQLLWLAALAGFGYLWLNRALKRVIIQGG